MGIPFCQDRDYTDKLLFAHGGDRASLFVVPETYYGKAYLNIPLHLNDILKDLTNGKIKAICINDTQVVNKSNFEQLKNVINKALEEKFPNKSKFEK